MGLVNFALKLIQQVKITYLFALEFVQNTKIEISDIIENRIIEVSLNHIFLILFGLIQLVELGEFN